jgi:large subunit ribosomal protein L21
VQPAAADPPSVQPAGPHAPAASSVATGSASPESGFRSIRGIGPALEERLREAGVTSVSQVAAWSDADVETIAPLLKVTPERIRSQAWVEQAQGVLASRPPD